MNKLPEIHRFDRLESTQDTAILHLQQSTNHHDFAIIAKCQTKGRGRSGQHWVSPTGGNLYVTCAVSLDNNENLSLLGYRACLGLIDAFKSVLSAEAYSALTIKWPNDIFYSESKCAGTLIEIKKQNQWALVGIGANLVNAPQGASIFPLQKATSADDIFCEWYHSFCRLRHDDDQSIIAGMNKRLAFVGRPVRMLHGNRDVIQGTIKDIASSGALRIANTTGQIEEFVSGQIVPGSLHVVNR